MIFIERMDVNALREIEQMQKQRADSVGAQFHQTDRLRKTPEYKTNRLVIYSER